MCEYRNGVSGDWPPAGWEEGVRARDSSISSKPYSYSPKSAFFDTFAITRPFRVFTLYAPLLRLFFANTMHARRLVPTYALGHTSGSGPRQSRSSQETTSQGIPHDLRKPHAPLFPKAPYARFLHNSRSGIFSTQNLREGRADLITPNARLPTALHPLAFDFLHHRAAFDKPTDRVRVPFLQVSSEIRCSEKRTYSQ